MSYNFAASGVKGRYLGFSLDNVSNSIYSYDDYGRLNSIGGYGGMFNYGRNSTTGFLSSMTRPNGINTAWHYDAYGSVDRVDNGAVSTFAYVLNDLDNITAMTRSGSAFAATEKLTYSYNDRSEVTGAVSDKNSAYNYAYNFDPIGNRLTANLAGTSYNYTSNNINQYTAVNTDTPTYDFDGNMLTNGAWTYTWNGENRMISAVNGNSRLEFAYDYMGRRVEKKVYDGETLSKHTKFVYNGFKLVEELEALNSNATLRKYTWQPNAVGHDVPLSVYDTALDATYFYTTDVSKNVSELLDSTGAIVAHYEYSPFGTQTVASGTYATTNPFRFSSEYFDAETGLVYYNYRYYNTILGRWMSKDPIGEMGGLGLYAMAKNEVVNYYDILGLDPLDLAGDIASDVLNGSTTRDVTLEGLDAWEKAMKDQLGEKFKSLCDKACEYLQQQGISKEDCKKEGQMLADAIIDNVKALLKEHIDKYGYWPLGGNLGNYISFFGFNGIKCDEWEDAVERAIAKNGNRIFNAKNVYTVDDWGLRHTWVEIYRPGSTGLDYDRAPGDFSIDFWPSGGIEIGYRPKDNYIDGGTIIGQQGSQRRR